MPSLRYSAGQVFEPLDKVDQLRRRHFIELHIAVELGGKRARERFRRGALTTSSTNAMASASKGR